MPLASHNNDSQPALSLPIAAPVLEYICLFTHDLKRKQKRWQDGRLKFHTFNKRIMVYDERGNFIGDMHWCEDFDFGEGEEFNLERGAVIVQVAECVGSKDQDLTVLLDKRAREVGQRHARSSVVVPDSPLPAAGPSIVTQNRSQAQFRQRHLADVFNTPRGPQGRAVLPTTSPYEDRIAAQQFPSPQDESQRPAKKRKRDLSPPIKSGYAKNLFGATLNLSPWSSSASVRSQPAQTPVDISLLPEATPQPVIPSRNTKPSHSRPFAIVDLTDDGPVSIGNSKPSAAINGEESVSNAMETPQSAIALAPKPFKPPAAGVPKGKATQGEVQPPAETEETPDFSGQQLKDFVNNSKSIAARGTTRKLHETKYKPALRQPDAQTCNDTLQESAPRRASATRKLLETCGALAKEVDNSVLQSVTEGPLKRRAASIAPDEPKTRLCIKSRQKRGLLIVGKRVTRKSPARRTDSPETGFPSAERQLTTDDTSSSIDQAARSLSPADTLLCRLMNGSVEYHASECEPTGMYDLNKIETPFDPTVETPALPGPEPVDDEDSQSSGEPVQSRVMLQECQKQLSSESSSDAETMNTQSGLRLASLGRRGVKSREIIGSFNKRLPRTSAESSTAAPAPRKEVSIPPKSDSEDGSPSKEADAVEQAHTRPEKAGRLINPATRGRKAAKKSDAAGSVPQPVLPAIPDRAVGRNNDRGGSRSESKPNTESVEARGETANKLPGGLKTNGGPWSREAYDLLGCMRPG